jgi:hypothetical protein
MDIQTALWLCLETFSEGCTDLYGFIYVSIEENSGVAYGLVIPLRIFPCEDGIYGRFLFYVQKEFEPIRYIPTKFRRREVCLFLVAADSVSVQIAAS